MHARHVMCVVYVTFAMHVVSVPLPEDFWQKHFVMDERAVPQFLMASREKILHAGTAAVSVIR